MDTTIPVNWEALDALVLDFAKSEQLIIEDPSSSSSSSYNSRLMIRQVRALIESGDVDSAIHVLRSHAPFVLNDRRIVFRLEKQKFIEMLRRGTPEGRESAIECLRKALAPCALDAYPEAYEEFKHVLLALIYDKDDQTSPVASEWSEGKRYEIAGLMSSVLRAHLHAYDPVFSVAMRYLISIHKLFCLRQGISSPISDLTERLLLEDRDPPAIPQDTLSEVPPFDEVDIQALAHAVELTRQGAVESLKFAKGDLLQAFQNELCRMRLNVSLLDELVREYCVYRGIVDGELGSQTDTQVQALSDPLRVNETESRYRDSKNCFLDTDHGTTKSSDGEASISSAGINGSPNNTDITSMEGSEVDLRYACEPAISFSDCSTSGVHQSLCLRVKQRNRDHVTGEKGKRKRWRGRYDPPGSVSGSSLCGTRESFATAPGTSTNMSPESQISVLHSVLDMNDKEDKYEFVLALKELASRGMAAEVVEEVKAIDPDFFLQNPALLFQLKQVEFLKLVSSGDHTAALSVACCHLGPLAANDQNLLKPLKETLVALLQPNEDGIARGLPLNALATSLQVAIGRRLGIQEPQIMKLIRATLHTHKEWFKLHMCKDRFETFLKIDLLKEAGTTFFSGAAPSKSHADSCTDGSSQLTVSSSARMQEDGGSPAQVSSGDAYDENAILKVMEFLALPRADAIHLLAQYNGNAETVIQQIFA